MVKRLLTAASALLLAGVTACGGSGGETGGTISVTFTLPDQWDQRLDSSLLAAPAATPYIGTVRFTVTGSGGSYSRSWDFPYDDRAGSFGTVDVSDLDSLTVETIAGGQVIMSAAATSPLAGSVALALEEAGGFAAAGSLAVYRRRPSAVLMADSVYVFGGTGSSRLIETVDVSAHQPVISALADSLTYNRTDQEAFADTINGQIFIFKGSSEIGDNFYEVIDVSGQTVTANSLVGFRRNYYPSHYSGKVFLVGGYDNGDVWQLDSAVINVANFSESLEPNIGISAEINETSCFTVNRYWSCVGGFESPNYLNILKRANLEPPSTIGDSTVSAPISNTSFASITGTQLLIAGGVNGNGIQGRVEILHLSTGVLEDCGEILVEPRVEHTMTALNNGYVLVTGGLVASGVSQTAELIDPAAKTSTLLPWKLNVPRWGHTATLLPDGRVLIVGGNMGDSTVEIFNPLN